MSLSHPVTYPASLPQPAKAYIPRLRKSMHMKEQLILSLCAPVQGHTFSGIIPRFPTSPFLNTTATAVHNLSKASFRDTKATRHTLPFTISLRSYTSQFSHVLCPGEFLCLHKFGRMLPLLFLPALRNKSRGEEYGSVNSIDI